MLQLNARMAFSTLGVLLSLLLLVFTTQGKVYKTTRMEMIKEYKAKSVEVCVRSLGAEAKMAVRLMIISNFINVTNFAFEAPISSARLSPEGSWHKLTVKHASLRWRHVLKASVDNEAVRVNVLGNGRFFTTAYDFHRIMILAEGMLEVRNCGGGIKELLPNKVPLKDITSPTPPSRSSVPAPTRVFQRKSAPSPSPKNSEKSSPENSEELLQEKGKVYKTTRMEMIKESGAKTVEMCVRSLSAETKMEVRLMIISNFVNVTIFAVEAPISAERLLPEGSWHKLTVKHAPYRSKHLLKASVDNEEVFIKIPGNGRFFTTAYDFHKIVIFAEGKLEVRDCSVDIEKLLPNKTPLPDTTSPTPSPKISVKPSPDSEEPSPKNSDNPSQNSENSSQNSENPSQNSENPSQKNGENPLQKNGENPLQKNGENPLQKNGEDPLQKNGENPLQKNGENLSQKNGENPSQKNSQTPSPKNNEKSKKDDVQVSGLSRGYVILVIVFSIVVVGLIVAIGVKLCRTQNYQPVMQSLQNG